MKQYIVLSMLFGAVIACDTETEQERYDRKFREGFRDGWVRKSRPTDFSPYHDEPTPAEDKKIAAKPSRRAKGVSVLKLVKFYSFKSTKAAS
jgi:hypothetical protein